MEVSRGSGAETHFPSDANVGVVHIYGCDDRTGVRGGRSRVGMVHSPECAVPFRQNAVYNTDWAWALLCSVFPGAPRWVAPSFLPFPFCKSIISS